MDLLFDYSTNLTLQPSLMSFVWKHFEKEADGKSVVCQVCRTVPVRVLQCNGVQVCRQAGRNGKLAWHNSTTSLANHLKLQHQVTAQGPKGLPKLYGILLICFTFPDQKKLNAYAVMACAAKEELTGP